MVQALLACFLLQNTWIVDDTPGPGVDFDDLPPAVAAAADGDIVLVLPGTYSHFTLAGKGLRILGSGSASTVVQGASTSPTTTISNLPADSLAYIDRLRFAFSPSLPPSFSPLLLILAPSTKAVIADVVVDGGIGQTALRVDAAEAWAFDCTLVGADAPDNTDAGGHAFHARNGAHVHLTGSSLLGGDAGQLPWCIGIVPFFLPAGRGAWIESGSQVWIADSTVRGGRGGCCAFGSTEVFGAPGAGILADACTVRVSGDSGTSVQGGDAATPVGSGSPAPGPATGIASQVGSTVTVHSVSVLPGACLALPCAPMTPTVGTGITLDAPPLPVLGLSGPLITTGTATISLSNGLPNAAFVIAFAASPGHVPGGSFFLGEILLDPVDWYLLAIGSLSPAGAVSVVVPLTGIPSGFVHLPVYLQGLAFDPAGLWRMSNSTVAVIRP